MSQSSRQLAHYHRFAQYDYSRGASLFITITTSPRRPLFGRVENAKMVLSSFGAVVENALRVGFTTKAEDISLFGFVFMPDHVHLRIYLAPGRESNAAIYHLNCAVGSFKSYTNHLYFTQYGGSGTLWQESYHDWLCLSREMIDAVERYMAYNALKWELRHNRGTLLALHEPLMSPRLGLGEYWRGIGATELLNDTSRQMVSLRVSRRCGASDIAALRRRLRAKAGELVVISGFISGGEREILGDLLANEAACAIKVSPYALAHDYQPGVALMPAIAAGRFAVIARGNSPEEISRAACLDLNARIIDIADRAAYALPGDIRWLK